MQGQRNTTVEQAMFGSTIGTFKLSIQDYGPSQPMNSNSQYTSTITVDFIGL
jgi:hypothetical protein